MIQAYRYGGQVFLKFGRKASAGVMYRERDLKAGTRPDVELWADGTVTYMDRPSGDISMMTRVRAPRWASKYQINRFQSRR